MSFTITYAQASFTSAANVIQAASLLQAVQLTPAITTAIEDVYLQTPGTAGPEVFPPVGQVWAFQFAGAGPLSGPEVTALNGVVSGYAAANYVKPGLVDLAKGRALGGFSLKALRVNAAETGIDTFVPVTSFAQLSDGFSLATQALKAVRVNAAGTALEPFTFAAGGDVSGPAGGTVANELSLFSDTTGKVLKGSGGVTLNAANGTVTFPAVMTSPGILSATATGVLLATTNPGQQDSSPAARIASNIGGGTFGATANVHSGTRNPDGNVSVSSGFYFSVNGVSSGLFLKATVGADSVWREAMHVAAASAPRRIVATKSGTLQSDAQFPLSDKRYVSGLQLAYVSGAPDSFTVAVGECMDETGVYFMQNGSSANVTCAAGNLDTGTVASATTYHVWVFGKSAGAETDVTFRFSLSPSAPTYPSGYNIRRRIGSIRTNTTTTFLPFFQFGNNGVRQTWFNADNTASPYVCFTGVGATTFTAMTTIIPNTALGCWLQVTTSTASMTVSLTNASMTNATNGLVRVAAAASAGAGVNVYLPLVAALSNGVASPMYKVSSGSTTITLTGFEEHL